MTGPRRKCMQLTDGMQYDKRFLKIKSTSSPLRFKMTSKVTNYSGQVSSFESVPIELVTTPSTTNAKSGVCQLTSWLMLYWQVRDRHEAQYLPLKFSNKATCIEDTFETQPSDRGLYLLAQDRVSLGRIQEGNQGFCRYDCGSCIRKAMIRSFESLTPHSKTNP